jgi:hypothetical protein
MPKKKRTPGPSPEALGGQLVAALGVAMKLTDALERSLRSRRREHLRIAPDLAGIQWAMGVGRDLLQRLIRRTDDESVRPLERELLAWLKQQRSP